MMFKRHQETFSVTFLQSSDLNIGQRTYADYELGKTRIPVDSLIILAKFYNVDMNYICGLTKVKRAFPR